LEALKQALLRQGDWLIVRLLSGKKIVLEKHQKDYWEETFAWGEKFADEERINPRDVLKVIKKVRLGK
jgi:hypothetical protein